MRWLAIAVSTICFGSLLIVACTVGSGTNRTPITQRVADACDEVSAMCTTAGECAPQQAFCGTDGTKFMPVFQVEDTCKNGCSNDTTCLKTCKLTRVQQITTTLSTANLEANATADDACSTLTQSCLAGDAGCAAREFFCTASAPPPSPCATQLDACKAACAPHDRDCLRACRAAYRQCLSGSPMPDGGTTMTYNLTTATSGTGTGTVAVNPAGTSCGANCSTYDSGTMVTLTATAAAGSTFAGWTGCTSTTNTCTVTMTSSLTVTAAFATQTTTTYNLTYTTSGTGTGTVAVNPAGTSCGANCATYDSGTMVTLTATAAAGSTFSGWTGCTSTTNTCTVTMTKALTVTAAFATQTVTTYNLTYLTGGTGTGTLTVNPLGTSCGANCATYASGTAVKLTATASAGSAFSSWTGCTSTTNVCNVTMTKAMTITANFTLSPPPVSLANDVQPILTAHCAGCHSGGIAPNLSAGKTYAANVNVTANGCSTAKYVVPGQPTQSYLITKVTSGSSLGGCNGGSMANYLTSSADLNTLTQWIAQGALNN